MQTMDDGAYHHDEQGSTVYLTGNSGGVENYYSYDAFGNVLEKKEDIQNRILYTGQQYDQETNQYYLRARYYNPLIGRFTQEDTYRGDGLNLYAYCGNNPVIYYDLRGHAKLPCNTLENANTEVTETVRVDESISGEVSQKNNLDPVQPYEVTTYEDFKNRSVVGDNIEGHEMWQHANLNENGYATTRLSTDASKNNPVMALPHEVHVDVNRAQSELNARTQAPMQNVMDNAQILYNHPAIPNDKVDEFLKKTQEHVNDVLKQ